jgi:hypothetical protein
MSSQKPTRTRALAVAAHPRDAAGKQDAAYGDFNGPLSEQGGGGVVAGFDAEGPTEPTTGTRDDQALPQSDQD